jgi:succinate-acetate transporter protein
MGGGREDLSARPGEARSMSIRSNLTTEPSEASGVEPAPALSPPGLRITLRPMASPLPLGFYTVAIATIMVSSLQLGIIDPAERRNVALIILPAFALQLIVGIACIAARDTIATTLMCSLAGSWLADALIYLFGTSSKSLASAVFFFTIAGFVAMMATAARPKAALFAVLVVAAPRFFFSGLAAVTGNEALTMTAGILGFVLAGVAIYTGWALLLEDVRGHTVLPVGRTGPARAAIEGSLAAQLAGYEHLAGIRRTL